MADDQKTILLVEDDSDIRETLVEILEEVGYAVTAADNGESALQLLRDGLLPRLILLDLMMPVMDGFQFRKAQLEDPRIAEVPVIVMTADGHVEEKRQRIGATDFLRKPLVLDQMFQVLERYFR